MKIVTGKLVAALCLPAGFMQGANVQSEEVAACPADRGIMIPTLSFVFFMYFVVNFLEECA